jgi:hypothetical protein
MEQHCRQCHSLAFEPKVTKRQAPHGNVDQLVTMLREFYAQLVLSDLPPDSTRPNDLPRVRPGAALTHDERQRALDLARQKAERVLEELFEVRGVCSTCHYVKRTQDSAGWRVAPVRLARVWMPLALFTHAKHSTQSCATCHDVRGSKHAEDIAMPDIGRCRHCHVGIQPVLGKVTSDCATCHKFHSGRQSWHGELNRAPLPQREK